MTGYQRFCIVPQVTSQELAECVISRRQGSENLQTAVRSVFLFSSFFLSFIFSFIISWTQHCWVNNLWYSLCKNSIWYFSLEMPKITIDKPGPFFTSPTSAKKIPSYLCDSLKISQKEVNVTVSDGNITKMFLNFRLCQCGWSTSSLSVLFFSGLKSSYYP